MNIYRQNFADMVLWQHYKIKRWTISFTRKCGFMLKSDIKSGPFATDPFFSRLDVPLVQLQSDCDWNCRTKEPTENSTVRFDE